MATRIELPKFQAFDTNGDPLSGGLLYTYIAGTTTLKTTYTDRDAGTSNANPVVLDARGEADVYGNGSYKLVLKDSSSVTIWTVDNVRGINETGITSIGDYSDDFDAAITAIGATETTLVVDSASTMSGVVTVPSTCKVKVEEGGSIDQSTYALTFNGPFECGPYQAFTGTGTVAFGDLVSVALPEWWGVDGTADNIQIGYAAASGANVELTQDYSVSGAVSLPASCHIFSRVGSTLTAANSMDANFFTVAGANVKIDGLRFAGNGANQSTFGNAFYCSTTSANNVEIKNCFADSLWGYFLQVADVTVSGWRVHDNHITNSGLLTYDASRPVISFQTGAATTFDDVMVFNNTIDTCGGGIQFYGDAGQAIENIHVDNNTILDVEAVPIEYNSTGIENSEVSGNLIQGGGTNGISGYFDHSTIVNNIVRDQTNYGVEWNGDGSSVVGNVIENCGRGIQCSIASSNFNISNNTIKDTTTAVNGNAIRFSEATYSNGKINNNLIIDAYTTGIAIVGTSTLGDAANIVIENNEFVFENARGASQVPTAVGIYDGKNISITGNKAYVYEEATGAAGNGIFQIARLSEQVTITGNEAIGVDALIDHTGIAILAKCKFLHINNNIIKNMATGILTTANTSAQVEVLRNSINKCTAPLTLQIYHKTEKFASSPTQGAMWVAGDTAWETAPTDSNPPGWVCSSSVNTEMRVAAVATATTMEVDDTTGMTAGDVAGVELDNGTWHWTTIDAVTDGDTFTLNAGLSGDGAAINNDVATFKFLNMAEVGAVKA